MKKAKRMENDMKNYDVSIIGAGPGGIFAAYELAEKAPDLKIAVFEAGNPLEKRKCPIDGKKIKSCVNCKTCAIMSGFGGAGAFPVQSFLLSRKVCIKKEACNNSADFPDVRFRILQIQFCHLYIVMSM